MEIKAPDELWVHKRLGFFNDSSNKTAVKYYHGNDDTMRERFLPAHRLLPWSWLLLITSVIWTFISIFIDLGDAVSGSDSGLWFQRSGAVLVISSLWVEWLTSRAELGGEMSMAFGHVSPSQRYVRVITLFSNAGLICAVAGTAVWAYGDKFIS